MEKIDIIRDLYKQDIVIQDLKFYIYGMDTYPSHIVSNNVFRVQIGNICEIVKVGSVSKITKEFNALNQLNSILQECKFIKVPKVFGMYRLRECAILRMSFEGFHTLEYYITCGKKKEVIYIIENILSALADNDILWYAVSPKNIMLNETNKCEGILYSLLDWEHGIRNMKLDRKSTYIRAMELHEEWISFDRRIFPYWSHHWPQFQELLRYSGDQGLLMKLNIQKMASRRIKFLVEICSLPLEITDAAYFRCLLILSSLHNDCLGKRKRVIYAADFISESGGSYSRVFCSMLIWAMRNMGICEGIELLEESVFQLGFFYEKSVLAIEKQKENLIDDFMKVVRESGSKIWGKQWKEKLVEICRSYILYGEKINNIDNHKYKVLLWI